MQIGSWHFHEVPLFLSQHHTFTEFLLHLTFEVSWELTADLQVIFVLLDFLFNYFFWIGLGRHFYNWDFGHYLNFRGRLWICGMLFNIRILGAFLWLVGIKGHNLLFKFFLLVLWQVHLIVCLLHQCWLSFTLSQDGCGTIWTWFVSLTFHLWWFLFIRFSHFFMVYHLEWLFKFVLPSILLCRDTSATYPF